MKRKPLFLTSLAILICVWLFIRNSIRSQKGIITHYWRKFCNLHITSSIKEVSTEQYYFSASRRILDEYNSISESFQQNAVLSYFEDIKAKMALHVNPQETAVVNPPHEHSDLYDKNLTVINMTNFKFLINNNICNVEKIALVTIIHNAAMNVDARQMIRWKL